MPEINESLSDRVEDTVYAWAGTPNPVDLATALKVLWGAQADTTPYPDPATRQLIYCLMQEFLSGPDARILKGLKPSLFADKAAIQSISDLITWVQNAPHPQTHAYIAGFTNAKAQKAFVNAIADEVMKRMDIANSNKKRAKKVKDK